jgi:hypothetical protein
MTMRFSAGHDYYDTALGFGRDDTLFFERSTKEKATVLEHKKTGFAAIPPRGFEFLGDKSWQRYLSFEHRGLRYGYAPRVVYFAGKRYAGVQMQATIQRYWQPVEEQFFWTKEAFREHLVELGQQLRDPDRIFGRTDTVNEKNFDSFFEAEATKAEIDWMIDNHISVAISKNGVEWDDHFRRGENSWIINSDGLDKLKFAKALDPYQAFQSLSQWVGGVLSGEGRPMVKITDEKVILSKHGFDKRSFKHRV